MSDMWDRPEYSDLKNIRDADPTLVSYETARPLIELEVNNMPLTMAQRTYVRRFYDNSMCQEFFCRLGLKFQNIAECWFDSMPTDEQCDRCAMRQQSFSVKEQVNTQASSLSPADETAGLYAKTDSQGILRFEWRPIRNNLLFKGLVGTHEPSGVIVHPKTSLEDVYPICLPSLNAKFKFGCDLNCAACPAHGNYDAVNEIVITNRGYVVVSKFSKKVKNALNKLVQQVQKQRGGETHGGSQDNTTPDR